jgi:hypothetical protein
MERIAINTGLKRFVMIDRITDVAADSISGEVELNGADPTLLVEAMAQMGGMHIRAGSDFRKHAFLVKIANTDIPAGRLPDGTYAIRGTVVSRSESAFAYRMEAGIQPGVLIHGDFLLGVVEYNSEFRQDMLQKHFREVFACLRSR